MNEASKFLHIEEKLNCKEWTKLLNNNQTNFSNEPKILNLFHNIQLG